MSRTWNSSDTKVAAVPAIEEVGARSMTPAAKDHRREDRVAYPPEGSGGHQIGALIGIDAGDATNCP